MPIIAPSPELQPAALFTATPKAAQRVPEFFTAQINNDNTRKAYLNAMRRFAEWCDKHSIGQLADVKAFHVAAFAKELQGDWRRVTTLGTFARQAPGSNRGNNHGNNFLVTNLAATMPKTAYLLPNERAGNR